MQSVRETERGRRNDTKRVLVKEMKECIKETVVALSKRGTVRGTVTRA